MQTAGSRAIGSLGNCSDQCRPTSTQRLGGGAVVEPNRPERTLRHCKMVDYPMHPERLRQPVTELAETLSKAPRKRPDGEATNDLVFSSHIGDNAPVFKEILDLHVPVGSTIADVTWGKGAFWKFIQQEKYKVLGSDLQTGVDCRDLPYEDESIDAVVLDPPYMEGLFRQASGEMAGGGSHGAFRERYSDGKPTARVDGEPKWHDAVLDLYYKAGNEAKRVLRNYGVFIVKCQDEVSANRQRLTHVELINKFDSDFYCKDLFVVTRTNRPGVVRVKKQEHARKNHSYFLVFIKRNPQFPKRIKPSGSEQKAIDARYAEVIGKLSMVGNSSASSASTPNSLF